MIGKTTRVLREKLQDCHGDTMVEVLAAVFIAALGATMLATMVTVSATASARSQQVLNASYAAEASLYDSSSYGPVVSVTLPDFDRSSHQSERIPVGRLCILRGRSVA